MKSFGNNDNEIDRVLDVYFQQRSLTMTCTELARSFGFLANEGIDPIA